VPRSIDPFQSVYKELADDMLDYRRKLSDSDVETIRATAKMKFAREFAPDAFADHMADTRNDRFVRCAACRLRTIPCYQRVERVREREYLFIDTLDEYFERLPPQRVQPLSAVAQAATYEEAIAYKLLRAEARRRTIGGAAAIVGGSGSHGGEQ
jgi:hypothetical protein